MKSNKAAIIGSTALLIVVAGVVLAVLFSSNNKDTTKTKNTGSVHNAGDNKSPVTKSGIQKTNDITYKGFAVVQKAIKIKKGTTVTWTNQDNAQHNVIPDTEAAGFKASELFGKNKTYKATFNLAGTYSYHCSPHPYMKGTIEVVEQ